MSCDPVGNSATNRHGIFCFFGGEVVCAFEVVSPPAVFVETGSE